MPRAPSPAAYGAIGILPIMFLLISLTVIIGVAGQSPNASVTLQVSYKPGQTSFLVINFDNRWWGRNITIYGISLSIANENPITLLHDSKMVPNFKSVGLVLNFTVPYAVPIGQQPYYITISYAQSQFWFFGSELQSLPLNGYMQLSY